MEKRIQWRHAKNMKVEREKGEKEGSEGIKKERKEKHNPKGDGYGRREGKKKRREGRKRGNEGKEERCRRNRGINEGKNGKEIETIKKCVYHNKPWRKEDAERMEEFTTERVRQEERVQDEQKE